MAEAAISPAGTATTRCSGNDNGRPADRYISRRGYGARKSLRSDTANGVTN